MGLEDQRAVPQLGTARDATDPPRSWALIPEREDQVGWKPAPRLLMAALSAGAMISHRVPQRRRGMNHRPTRPRRIHDAVPAGLTQSTPGEGDGSLPASHPDCAHGQCSWPTGTREVHTDHSSAERPSSCGPHSWPLTHSFQTVGSTLKPGDPTLGPAAAGTAFPTSLHLQGTGCWNLRAASDSQLDHMPSAATLARSRS